MINKAIKPPCGWTTEKYDTEYAFWTEDNKAYLTFQGSLSVTDWIFNLMFFTKKNHYFFHAGMLKKYKVIEKPLIKFMEENWTKEIIFTGHSQGAAISLISFIIMKILFPYSNIKAILFACPKILNLISYLQLRKHRSDITLYEVRSDIVPKLVPTYFSLGIKKKIGPKKIWSIKDHYPSTYKKYLKEE